MARGRPELTPWLETLVRGREQALEDVAASRGSEVTFARTEVSSVATQFADAVQRRAWDRGFVVAEVSLGAITGLDAFDSLVRTVLRQIGMPGTSLEERGLTALLNALVNEQGAEAPAWLQRGLSREAVYGELGELCRAYVDTTAGPRREAVRLQAWIDGTQLKAARATDVTGALTLRSSKRALSDLSRIVRALGYRGTLIVLTRGETLSRLPAARRRNAYTLLRELVDNVDGGRGLVATSLLVITGTALLVGDRSIAELTPLALRVGPLPGRGPQGPHATTLDLDVGAEPGQLPSVRAPARDAATGNALRALLRGAHGLPPTEGVPELSVGYQKIDAAIAQLFAHASMDGSVFSLLTGAYGAGKTHLLLHLAERALAERRPVLRLSIERLDADLGNPQRHLRRLLEDATLPLPGRPSPLDLAHHWRRTRATTQRLLTAVAEVAAGSDDAARAAHAVLARIRDDGSAGDVLHSFLGASDLASKSGQPGVRAQAYSRLLLWLELLKRLESLSGPILIVDEAENLYRGGVTRAERRTALRSLAFYASGALPGGCVILAVTPEALDELRAEARELLTEVSEQAGVLQWEDATMLERRLRATRPLQVPALGADAARSLAERIQAVHARVRGDVHAPGLDALVKNLTQHKAAPREIVRRVLAALEAAWWTR